MPSSCRPTVAEIDLGACVHNLRRLRDKVGAIDVWPVVKADAYGHGAVAVAIPHEILSLIGSRVPRRYSTSAGNDAAEVLR